MLCVDTAGADPCTSDRQDGAELDIALPGKRLASERGRSRTMLVSWQATTRAGAGVSYYSVDVREVANGVRTSKIVPGDGKSIVDRTTLTGVHFRGARAAYQFRITAVRPRGQPKLGGNRPAGGAGGRPEPRTV